MLDPLNADALRAKVLITEVQHSLLIEWLQYWLSLAYLKLQHDHLKSIEIDVKKSSMGKHLNIYHHCLIDSIVETIITGNFPRWFNHSRACTPTWSYPYIWGNMISFIILWLLCRQNQGAQGWIFTSLTHALPRFT